MRVTRLNTTVLQALNIRQEEIAPVRALFLHYFFQGFGIALFFTVANTQFLSHFPITSLPMTYVAAAAGLLVVGRGYAWLEHHWPLRRLLQAVVWALLASVLLAYVGVQVAQYWWVGLALVVWYRVLYLLSSLEFWGLSALLFDVRQSKRLFGLISSGDVPAKLLGYLSVSVLVPLIGLNNLLLLAGGGFLLCLVFLQQLLRSQAFLTLEKQEAAAHHSHGHEHGHHDHHLLPRLRRFFGNEFILSLAGLSLLYMVAVTFVDFSFLSEVQDRFQTEEELARFLGLFFSFGYTVTIISKLFFSGRIIGQLGVKRALLILPVALLCVSLGVLLSRQLSQQYTTLLWFFGIMVLLSDTFKRILHEPTFLALFQPLTRHLRLHGHTVVKGVVDPIGLGVAGLVLYAGVKLHGSADLYFINYFLLAVLAGWIGMVLLAQRQYLAQLGSSLNKRFLSGTGLEVKDRKVLDLLASKLRSPYPEEAIYALELLQKSSRFSLVQCISQALEHPDEDVRIAALQVVAREQVLEAKTQVLHMLQAGGSARFKEAAIKACCALDEEAVAGILPQLEDPDLHVRKGAIAGLIRSGDLEAVVLAGQQLLELTQSQEPEEKRLAAALVGELGMKNFYKPVLRFLEEQDPALKLAAIEASGKIGNVRLLPALTACLREPHLARPALNALAAYGEVALLHLESQVPQQPAAGQPDLRLKLVRLSGRVGGELATRLLKDLLHHPDLQVRTEALKALRQTRYKTAPAEHPQLDELLDAEFRVAAWCLQVHDLLTNQAPYAQLRQALAHEVHLTEERIFNLLTFLYDTATLQKAKEALAARQREKRANALEMLDNLLEKKVQHKLFLFLEELPQPQRLAELGNQFGHGPETAEQALTHILAEADHQFSSWTQAAALYALPAELTHLALPYVQHPHKLLRQISQRAVVPAENTVPAAGSAPAPTFAPSALMHAPAESHSHLLEIEKVLILKRTSIFASTPEGVLADLAAIVQEEHVPAGKTIFYKGDFGSCMYVIYEGEIKIHDGEHEFARLHNRELFGELALLDPEPRSASATALTDSLLLRLDEQAFYELMDERPEVARGILKVLCQRLRNQNLFLSGKKKEAE